MAQSPRLFEGPAAPRVFAPQPRNDRCDVHPRNVDWDLARVTKANLLLVGGEQTVSNLVFAMWSIFDGPIAVKGPHERLRLLPAADPVGTLVLYGADTLTTDEQASLNHWLVARTGRTRVITTSSVSLLPLVESGAFSDELYYRLNTIWVDLRPF